MVLNFNSKSMTGLTKKISSSISVVIFTKNEENNISQCIKSVRGFADEIIVIDMQSKDDTVKIAKSLGAVIYPVEDINWVEPVRNFGINKAKNEWVLVLDADERVPLTLAKKLVGIVKEDKYDAVKIPYKVIFFKKWIRHTQWWPDYHVRFFRKGHVKWVIKIHPDIKVSGRELVLKAEARNAIIHENARNIKAWLEKIDHHTDFEDYFFNLKSIGVDEILGRFRREFYWRYFESQGYLDGMHGFVLSKFMEFYRFLEFVKFWEKKGYPELVEPNRLRKALEKQWGFTNGSFEEVQEKNSILQAQLQAITSSRTFKIWQKYCQIRDQIKKFFK